MKTDIIRKKPKEGKDSLIKSMKPGHSQVDYS